MQMMIVEALLHPTKMYSNLCFGILLVLVSVCLAFGQSEVNEKPRNSWSTFAPSGKGFSIELPGVPRTTQKHNPGMLDEREYFRCTDRLDAAYKLEINPAPVRTKIEIGVFDVGKCKRKISDFESETLKIVKLFSADDADDEIIRDEKRTLGKYPARLIVTRTAALNHVWEFFSEANGRIYWLLYSTRDPKADISPEAERIFNSFKIETN